MSQDYQQLMRINNLSVDFKLADRSVQVVDSLSMEIEAGESVALVGESGSGKSVTALAMMGLIRQPGNIGCGKIFFRGENLLALSNARRRRILGNDISMIFQEPMSCLNPAFSIGEQILETLKIHGCCGKSERIEVVHDLLAKVGMQEPKKIAREWPHQLSGGMNQRAMIAMAIACKPALLIADEPTTALDVSVQAQILGLLRQLQQEEGMAMLFISHDLAVVSQIADRVIVMYAGQVVETFGTEKLFSNPRHPYTGALLRGRPENFAAQDSRFYTIPGSPPRPGDYPGGCRFHPRCEYAQQKCAVDSPDLSINKASKKEAVRCFFPLGDESAVVR